MAANKPTPPEDDADELLERHADLLGMTQREYKQSKWIIWAFFAVTFAILGGVMGIVAWRQFSA